MKKIILAVTFFVMFFSAETVNARVKSGEITIDLTGAKEVYTQSIGKNLLLRITKDSSVKYKNFGWIIEVIKKPYKTNSRNLIYQNKTGTTADLSQIYAWHIGSKEFSNKRKLKVKGYPLTLRITIINPKIKGKNENARFVSGKLQINWN